MTIHEVLIFINQQTGLDLKLCDYFTGMRECNGRNYFNVVLNQRTSVSQEFDALKRFADKYKLIQVEPNGVRRVAVYVNGL